MITQLTLPACLIHKDPVLPGNAFSFIVKDEENKKSIEIAESSDNTILILFQKNDNITSVDNSIEVGLVGYIVSKNIDSNNNEVLVTVMCDARARLANIDTNSGYYAACAYAEVPETVLSTENQALFAYIKENILTSCKEVLADSTFVQTIIGSDIAPSVVCDAIVENIVSGSINKYDYLLDFDFSHRLQLLVEYVAQLVKVKDLINDKVMTEIDKEQKDYYLRKKIKIIQEELGDIDSATRDADNLQEKIESAGMPKDIKEKVIKELKRYKSTPSMSPDSNMIRAYIDLMLELPWTKETTDNLDISAAKAKLDETHFGLEKVKDRILEYLSVKLYTGKNPQTILCLAGAPGVGKTTLARSIAEALGRKFVKQSMGGVKDEAEIRGHRRTYIGALPGRIINGIKEAGVTNPVFLLDEIDKIGSDYKGDPSAALLEVLDPAQNVHFMDHYTEVEYDLSKVMFICTANYLENVPAPLRDRMEIIEVSSYTELEKLQIGKSYVVRRSLEKNGLELDKFEITDDAIMCIIKHYTREAGARELERCVDSIVRKAIKIILTDHVDKVIVDEQKVYELLGKKLFDHNEADEVDLVGVVNGLAYTQAGGDTLQIEVQPVKGKGNIQLTGKLGDVMKESAEVAYTWVKAHANEYKIDLKMFEEYDIHIHVPEGATPKDGPSAGITLTTAIVSALSDKPVRHEIGMTGEITLRGKVLPIGGLKEKSIAAYRTGLKKILIPEDNIKDLDDIPQEVKDNVEILPVSKITEVLSYALVL